VRYKNPMNTRHRLAPLPFLVITLAGCGTPPKAVVPPPMPRHDASLPEMVDGSAKLVDANPGDAIVDEASEKILAFMLKSDPEWATDVGKHDADFKLTDRSDSAVLAVQTELAAMLSQTERRVLGNKTSARAAVDLEVLRSMIRFGLLQDAALDTLHRMPDEYVSGPLGAFFAMAARDYAPSAERAALILERMERLELHMAVARENLRKGVTAEERRRPPKVWVEIGIEAAKSAPRFFASQRAFLVAALPGDPKKIDAAIAKASKTYADFTAFLSKEILPKATGTFAVGTPVFQEFIRARYGLTQTPQELESQGKASFEKLSAMMETLAKEIDPSASGWPAVLARLKRKHPRPEDLIATYTHEVARARAYLVSKNVVTFPAEDHLEVQETPQFLRATTTASYDVPPPFDLGTKGFFFVTPVDLSKPKTEQEAQMREHDDGDIVDTAVHEAYPGHHLQLSIARRHPSMIRRIFRTPIFSEGWALYSEELMNELGYYTKEERMLQLEWALVRAARVFIDVGLHTGTLTQADAVKFLTLRVHLEKPLAESEVKRYCQTPTQPLAYWIGREEIFGLRERYKLQQGSAYTLKGFHDALLSKGTIPPALVARELFP
jgi:uncharacterized protein (DUF885 family)